MFGVQGKKLYLTSGMALLFSCGFAHAQSSVTIYGILDTGLLITSKPASTSGQTSGHLFAMNDSGYLPSQFGFMGEEDLGGGLKAKFNLNSGIDLANGGFNNSNGNLFGRQAWVALDGNFGAIKVGEQFSPLFDALADSDPRGVADFGSGLINYADNAAATGGFNSNAVSYTSPKLAGFTGKAMVAFGGVAGNFQAGRQYAASLKWESADVMVDAAIYDGNAGGADTTPVPSTLGFLGRMLGASYKFGDFTAKADFFSYKVAGSFNNNVFGGGFDWVALPELDINGGVYVTSDRDDTSNHSLMASLGTQYFLSRRTTLYAQVGMVNNHGAMNTGLDTSDLLFGNPGTTYGMNIGITQSF
jgi:predicted porin